MIGFIDAHRQVAGVEPMCRLLQIAPSTYYTHKAQERDLDLRSDRAKSDEVAMALIKTSHKESHGLYGARKVYHDLRRQGHDLARCTIERLMRAMGLQGARALKRVRTTVPDPAAACPLDKVQRHFHAPAPNRLWISDFTYASTWQVHGLSGLRGGCLRAQDRGLAGINHYGDDLRLGCLRASPS